MKKKLKICHVITRMIIGGAQENTLFSCRGQIEDGHDVVLLTGPTYGPEGTLLDKQQVPGLKIEVMEEMHRSIRPLQDLKAVKKMKEYFLQEKFDVVHTHASKAGILGRKAAWEANVPCVVHTIHGSPFHPYEKAWKNAIYVASEKYAAKKCHKVLAVADAMRQLYADKGVIPFADTETVYSGMDLSDYLSDRNSTETRRELNIPEEAFVIVKVARLFEHKGHDYLMKAAEKVCADNAQAIFLLVGDGLLRSEIEDELKEKGLEKNFRFTGLVPPTEVPKYIHAADALIHLSLREGLPRAVVQGMAAAKPVVGYDLDGSPEVILNGIE